MRIMKGRIAVDGETISIFREGYILMMSRVGSHKLTFTNVSDAMAEIALLKSRRKAARKHELNPGESISLRFEVTPGGSREFLVDGQTLQLVKA